MKFLKTICFLLCSLAILEAQPEKNEVELANFQPDLLTAFEHLDLSEITADFFYDKAYPFIGLELFDGSSHSLLLDVERFGKVYATLYGAAMSDAVVLSDPSVYMDARVDSRYSDTIPIGMILYDYQLFKEDAIADNLIDTLNGQFYDVPNRPESPYQQKTVFAASLLHHQANSYDLVFSLTDNLLFSNKTNDIDVFQIDLGDGNGFQTIATQEFLTASYIDNEPKKITVRCTLTDGTVLQSFTYLLFDDIASNRDYSGEPDTIIDIPGTSDHTGGHLDVFYNCPSEGLVKPFVIIDGFDPPQNESRTWEDMKKRLEIGAYMDNGILLIEFLEAEGYDLIFMDYTYGSDFLERNKDFVKDGIRKLNLEKAATGSPEQNVIAGGSMGGVLGKYALLEMEADEEDHETRLFINFDGPMLGANVPVGLQAMVGHMANTDVRSVSLSPAGNGLFQINNDWKPLREFVPGLGNFHDLFKEPATKQFLYYQTIDGYLVAPEYVSFYSAFEALGEPENFEYITLCNASVTSMPQQLYDAGDELIDIDMGFDDFDDLLENLDEYTDININAGWADVFHVLAWIENIASYGLLTTRVKADFDVWALPDNPGSSKKVYHGKLIARILGLKIAKTNLDYSVKGTQPYDSAPGGILGFNPSKIPGDWYSDYVTIHHTAYSFVPAVSSLEIQAPDRDDLFLDLTSNANVVNNLTTVLRYDASTDASIISYEIEQENQKHAQINTSNAPFFLFEMTSGYNGLVGIPAIGDRTYNFAMSSLPFDPDNPTFIPGTSDRIQQDLVVENTGKLWVNRDDKIGFTDVSTEQNTNPTHFDVYLRGKCENQTTLTLQNGGELYVGDWLFFGNNTNGVYNTANLYVQQDATLLIKTGGIAKMDSNSKIIVGAGGRVKVEAGGTLQTTNTSQIIVESGGILEIDASADIELWWSESTIHIEHGGELLINGDFNFDGSGYFQFDNGNILSFGPNADAFRLIGPGADNRMIRLNAGATLQLTDVGLDLENGRVECNNFAGINVDRGFVRAYLVKFYGNNTNGDNTTILTMTDPESLNIEICRFYDATDAIILYDFDGVPSSVPMIWHTEFHDCTNSVSVRNSSRLSLSHCDFNAGSASINGGMAIRGEDVDEIELFYSGIYDYLLPGDFAAVELHDVALFNMRSSTIDNSSVGIWAPCEPNEIINKTNVILQYGATISNCHRAIHIEKGGTSDGLPPLIDYGLVSMRCAKLINNQMGIEGVDVLLDIDGCTANPSSCMPNRFELGNTGGDYFDIVYVDRDDITEIIATGNYWDLPPATGGGASTNYSLQQANSFAGCQLGSNNNTVVTLNDNDALSVPPINCTNTPPGPGGGEPTVEVSLFPGTPYECTVMTTDGQHQLPIQYASAAWNYDAGNKVTARTKFQTIANISSSTRAAASQICRHHIDVARVMDYALTNANQYSNSWEEENVSEDTSLKIWPNPASESIQITFNSTPFEVRVYDVLGKIHYITTMNDGGVLSIANWDSGLYWFTATNPVDGTRNTIKLVVE